MNKKTAINRSVLKESPYLAGLREEIAGAKGRVEAFFDLAASDEVDRVLVVVGCDDQRVEVPGGVHKVKFADGEKNTLFHFVPSIGGGKDNVLVDVLGHWTTRDGTKIPKEKIQVFVTSHGSSETIESGGEKVTCGALGALAAYEEEIQAIKGILDPDEQEELLSDLNERSHIPPRLLRRLADSTHSSNAFENSGWVLKETQKKLVAAGLGDVNIDAGVYNHTTRAIHLLDGAVIEISGLDKWEKDYQNPPAIAFSHGVVASSAPDGVLLTASVGLGVNGDFNIATAIDIESILGGFSEGWYATAHTDQDGDNNFEDTDRIISITSDSEAADNVKAALQTSEFKRDFSPSIVEKFGGGIYLVNLENESVEFVRVTSEEN